MFKDITVRTLLVGVNLNDLFHAQTEGRPSYFILGKQRLRNTLLPQPNTGAYPTLNTANIIHTNYSKVVYT